MTTLLKKYEVLAHELYTKKKLTTKKDWDIILKLEELRKELINLKKNSQIILIEHKEKLQLVDSETIFDFVFSDYKVIGKVILLNK